MVELWVLSGLGVAAVAVFALLTALFLRHCERLSETAPSYDGPPVSVIIPARNEAANIEACVRSVLHQQYGPIEVIVIDDGSTDGTGEILTRLAEDHRLHIVTGASLPDGWTGKNHALVQGVRRAKGAYLLFIDADVTLHPAAVGAAMHTAQQRQVSLLSMWVRQVVKSWGEQIAQPVIIGFNLIADPLMRTNSPRYPHVALGNGQFLLVERSAYERIGGHTAVASQVVEDQELTRAFKRAGYRTLMLDGTALAHTRMYTSLAEVWHGWSKNNFLTMGCNYLRMSGAALAVFLVAVVPFLAVVVASAAGAYGPLALAVASVGGLLLVRYRTRRFVHSQPAAALLHAIGALIFIGIFFYSAYRYTFNRGAVWKGRTYPTGT